MTFASYHDELAKLMSIYQGKVFESKDIKSLFDEAYPQSNSAWVQPSDHCIDHIVEGACKCAETEQAIFSRPKRNTYTVL